MSYASTFTTYSVPLKSGTINKFECSIKYVAFELLNKLLLWSIFSLIEYDIALLSPRVNSIYSDKSINTFSFPNSLIWILSALNNLMGESSITLIFSSVSFFLYLFLGLIWILYSIPRQSGVNFIKL